MILFAGQGQVQFAGANYAPFEMTPDDPYVNFTDEIVYFTNEPSLVHSFMRKFDDLWIEHDRVRELRQRHRPLTRSYPDLPDRSRAQFPAGPELPQPRARRPTRPRQQKIDVLMFRITDEHAHATR